MAIDAFWLSWDPEGNEVIPPTACQTLGWATFHLQDPKTPVASFSYSQQWGLLLLKVKTYKGTPGSLWLGGPIGFFNEVPWVSELLLSYKGSASLSTSNTQCTPLVSAAYPQGAQFIMLKQKRVASQGAILTPEPMGS